jgi:hypothetical protein
VTRYSLTPRLTSYHVWAATSARLDDGLTAAERAELPGEGETLRERFAQTPRRLEDVGTLPTPAKVGVGVVVVTNDGHMVLGLRGKTWVASHHDTPGEVHRVPVHFVAEGMSPDDLDESGRLSPIMTARRGMIEELGLGDVSRGTGQVVSLRQVGVFFDSKRWQPCFAFVAHVDRSFDELLTLVTSARDFWEADQLLALPFDLDNPMTRDLMLGRHRDYVFASNHAHALSYFALLDEFGLEHMVDAMRSRSAWRTTDRRGAPQAAGRQRVPL